uniref:UBC core domain-containing protein n=13 Tax=Eutheria TaxID=9347 RepID=A0ABI8AEM5_FELCA
LSCPSVPARLVCLGLGPARSELSHSRKDKLGWKVSLRFGHKQGSAEGGTQAGGSTRLGAESTLPNETRKRRCTDLPSFPGEQCLAHLWIPVRRTELSREVTPHLCLEKLRHRPTRTGSADPRHCLTPPSRLPTAGRAALSARSEPPEKGIRLRPPFPGQRTPPRPAPGPTPCWDVIKKTPKAQRPVPGRRSPTLPASSRTGVLDASPRGGRRRPPGGRKLQGACALGPLPPSLPPRGCACALGGPGAGTPFPGVPRGRARRCGPGPAAARRRSRGEGGGAGGGAQAQRGAGRAGQAEASAGRAAVPERVERSGAPSGGGGGGGGGVEEEGGGGGPSPGASPAGARPGPSRASAAAPRPSAPPTPGPAAAAAAMARPLVPSSQKALLLELKGLQEEPVEGFRVTLVDEGDLYNWEVAIFGPPNTYYEGGYFKARLKFPIDYPYSPPAFRFLTKMWHPNIYETGDVCISILHPPVDDPQSGELPSERWNPTQNVRTILLSVISLLNEPNTFSPANVDASVMYRKWKESKGKDREYTDIIRKQVLGTKVDAERDGVKVPTTLAEYCVKTKAPAPDEGSDLFYDDYYEDGEPEAEADSCFGDDEDDSGNEES